MAHVGFIRLFFLISMVVFLIGPAQAGKKEDILLLQQQVATMEQQIQTLINQAGQNNADALVKITNLQQQNQDLTGQVEALSFELGQMRERLDLVTRLLAGENFSGLETGVNGTQGIATGAPADLSGGAISNPAPGEYPNTPTDGQASIGGVIESAVGPVTGDAASQPVDALGVALPLDANAAYDYASNFLLDGDYTRAREAFVLYVQTFPNSRYAPDAQFRLGEIYLATGDNALAVEAFIQHIRAYGNDPRAPEAYLKLGTAFVRLQDNAQACQIFKQVRAKYPSASPIVLERTDIEMQRIDCS